VHTTRLGAPRLGVTANSRSEVRRRYGNDMEAVNVLGGPLEECGTEPMTGFFRDGACTTAPEDVGSHTICAVMTEEFLAHQRGVGNDLSTPLPLYGFPGLHPGDRWCVVAARWLQAHRDGVAAPVILPAPTRARSPWSRSRSSAVTASTCRTTRARCSDPPARHTPAAVSGSTNAPRG